MKSKTIAVSSTTSNMKGRITRIDQAWDAAIREDRDRGRVHDIMQARAEAHLENIERGRVHDMNAAWDEARQLDEDREIPDPVLPGKDIATIPTSARPATPASASQSLAVPINLVSAALLAAGNGDIRHYLNGVFIHSVGAELRVCGSDGHRMIVSRYEVVGMPLPEWTKAGIILGRDELAQALPILSKNASCTGKPDQSDAMLIDYATDAEFATLRAVNGFASFRINPVSGPFPQYDKVLEAAGATLARNDMEALQASAINTKYIKGAADIANKLGSKSVRSFVGSKDGASAFFTFDGAPNTVLIVMPMRDGTGVSDGVVKLVGRNGISLSIAAIRAHVTRTEKAITETRSPAERKELESKKTGFMDRIAQLMNLTQSGNQLTSEAA